MVQTHGAAAPVKIAERIGALALAGDAEGVSVWKRIATAADQLTDPGGARHPRN